ncbi:MAG: sterol desaturase family protein [Psychroflexus sp.]|nr:sterol desaturase family protein [Psychroflexus sp.]MDR9448622.1 sterol desaturase family protein [Psychroflexus sp.]
MKSKVTTDFKHGEAKIFDNPFLESLTKTNPTQNIIVYGLAIISLILYAYLMIEISPIVMLGLFLFGTVFWTLSEYLLHRFLFHWVNESEFVQRFHFVMHGSHHEYPRDKSRLLMPPVPGLIMASFLFFIFYGIFYLFNYSWLTYGFFPGFFTGYLLYSFVHRAIHTKKPPKRFKHLWLHHNIHHFKHPDKAFGVSNRFWDRVFGTMPPRS